MSTGHTITGGGGGKKQLQTKIRIYKEIQVPENHQLITGQWFEKYSAY
jgi:hypothetical protein